MVYLVTNQILPPTESYEIISVSKSLEMLQGLKVIGLDTETAGLDPYTKELLLLQLGCPEFQIVIDCTTIDVTFYKELLEDKSKLFIGWNIKFDAKFLLHKRVILREIFDGYTAERLLYNGYPKGMHPLSLKHAGETYCNVVLDKSVRGKIIWSKTLTDEIILYAANDVKYLEPIMNAQIERLKALDLLTSCDYQNHFVVICAYFEYCGVKLDIAKWKIKMDKDMAIYKKAVDDLNSWVVKNLPNSKYLKQNLQGDLFEGFNTEPKCIINWASPKQVQELLIKLGFNLLVKDKEKGGMKYSTEAKVLKPQKNISSILEPFLKFKGAQKSITTYGQNVLDEINPVSGRLHTNFNANGTDTLRLSSGGKDKENKVEYINFQNFPAEDTTRECFICEPGNVFISCDYAAQESRIMAEVTEDPAMLELFNNGCGDTHSLVCKMAFPEVVGDTPVEEIKSKFKGLRNDTKSWVEFPINYGGDANTIHQHSGKSMEEATRIYNNYMKGFPGIKKFQDNQRAFVAKYGYIILDRVTRGKAFIYDFEEQRRLKESFTSEFWNRYREIPKDSEGKKSPKNPGEVQMISDVKSYFKRKGDNERQAIDYPCQGCGAIMFKVACMYIWKYLLEHNLVFTVKLVIACHDEVDVECPKEMQEEIKNLILTSMLKAGSMFCKHLKMPADAVVSDHWIH